jgi:hypothetical protein
MLQPNKVQAIYSLRDAAEQKAMAELALRSEPSAQHREEFLDAQLTLESKTQDAIEACHECGEKHHADQPHAARGGNIIDVDFGPSEGR